ncbi:hypothetical protein [Actinomadura sp. 6N118]|uniref:hypothetical protein n=1 Tax=Actinomadura sp. 6N118 TaxID=3375151 RepID=UPI0037B59DF8
MTGDYTKVPLREADRWTGARMQQGRVLFDHDWNLNLDAAARTAADTVRDVVGGNGVPEGGNAFKASLSTTTPRKLTIEGGRMWVDGLCAFAPAAFSYLDQDVVPPLPQSGKALVYLEVFTEHLQPAENWEEIVDPALDPIDAAARTRVGWRVRAVSTTAASCQAALAALAPARLSTGRMTITRTAPPAAPDPCDPPGDPLGLLPDGLLRVEVLDSGSPSTARFVWAADNGAATARISTVNGTKVTLATSPSVKFQPQDLLEFSGLARRADRTPHGALFTVVAVTADIAGDVLTLDRPPTVTAGARGMVVRRWDGQQVGAATAVTARVYGVDLGLRFTAVGAAIATFLAGDWWGAWLRPASATGVEQRTAAPPDGTPHGVVPLGFADLDAGTVEDCRPVFPQLAKIGRSTCTVTAFPGDDLQTAVDQLPATGGELCLAAGRYTLAKPVKVTGRKRVTVTGVGPATVLAAPAAEATLLFENCTEVEVSRLRAEGGPGGPAGAHLDGALTFVSCVQVKVSDCDLACADALADRSQTCLTVRGSAAGMPRQVTVRSNRLEVGVRQTGILVVDSDDTLISGNDVRFVPSVKQPRLPALLLAAEMARIGLDFSEGSAARYGPKLKELRALLNNQAAALINSGVPRRRALHIVARNRVQETPADKAHEIVGATAPGQLLNAMAGIVVAGQRARTVRVLDNLVDGAAQGIHVATSVAATATRESAGEVMVSRNVVRVLIPLVYNRGRHAVFVGNVRRLSVLDNVAELIRIGKEEVTPADGVRVYGVLGPQLMVRNSALTGFNRGVFIRAKDPVPQDGKRLWVVIDTLAAGTPVAVVAPFPFDPQRNVAIP